MTIKQFSIDYPENKVFKVGIRDLLVAVLERTLQTRRQPAHKYTVRCHGLERAEDAGAEDADGERAGHSRWGRLSHCVGSVFCHGGS